MNTATSPLLAIEDLSIGLNAKAGRLNVVQNVSFAIEPGEAFGLVGESGCGKSLTALSIMGLLKRPLSVGGGRILFQGTDILSLPSRRMRHLRGNRIAMIFQEPMTALNPLKPVGRQVAEMFVLHQGADWKSAHRKAVEALDSVQIPSPDLRARNYPHHLSGGMRQRVMIAIALACDPDLLIADEPTTALDVTVQAGILDLMKALCAERGTAILMVSHDLGVIAKLCRRVGVMYAGQLVETRATAELFQAPSHPYSQGLLQSLPRLGSRLERTEPERLREIEGTVPNVRDFTAGCRFAPRCEKVTEICQSRPPEKAEIDGGIVRCYHHD